MRKLFLLPLLAILSIAFCGTGRANAESESAGKKCLVVGVAFYNLENLFDTINNNGKYCQEPFNNSFHEVKENWIPSHVVDLISGIP